MSGVAFGFQSESVQFVRLFRPARHQFENRRFFIGVRSAYKEAKPDDKLYNKVSQRLYFFFLLELAYKLLQAVMRHNLRGDDGGNVETEISQVLRQTDDSVGLDGYERRCFFVRFDHQYL